MKDVSSDSQKMNEIRKLRDICTKKLYELKAQGALQDDFNVYWERLCYELKIIKELGYENIFLITREFIAYSRNRGVVVGPGRGSAAGSLVCFLCGITCGVDPIQYGLRFERFLNPSRVTSADIDVDFSNRETPIEFLRETYGVNRVIQVGTKGLFKLKSALDEFARTYGLDFKDAKRITACFDDNGEPVKEEDAKRWEALHPDLFKTARFFADSKRYRNPTRHPSAVIVTDEPIGRLIPLQNVKDSKSGERVLTTEWDGDELEKIGYTKFDVLRVSVLNVIADTVGLVNKRTPGKLPSAAEIFDWVDVNDKATLELADNADLVGVFQLWKPECLRLFSRITVSSFRDFYHITTVIRPGIDKDEYIRLHENPEQVTYVTPELKPILESTYGIILYQEQIMDICHRLAGFTLAEADTIRKIIAKTSNSGDKLSLAGHENQFVDGCVANGISRRNARLIWEEILKRQRYGFNLSHAVAYSLISFVTAYLKAHHPLEFLCASLNDKNEVRLVRELQKRNLAILPPDVNRSEVDHSIEGNGIRVGLRHVKHVGRLSEAIVKSRPYVSVDDFKARAKVDSKVYDVLRDVGALDCLHSVGVGIQASKAQSKPERLKAEFSSLGYYISGNPIDEYRDQMAGCRFDLSSNPQKARVGGIVVRAVKHMTKANKPMMFVSLNFGEVEQDLLLFTRALEKHGPLEEDDVIVADVSQLKGGGFSINSYRKIS